MTRKIFWLLVNIAQASFTAFWTLILAPFGLLAILLTFSTETPLMIMRRVWAPGLLWGARAKLEVRGLQNVDFSKPHVFVVNHQSTIDIPAVFAGIPVNLHFILKKELFYVPVVGFFAWSAGMIFVNRRETLRSLKNLARVGELIRGGKSVIAFPEGTRNRGGPLLPFKKGVFAAAITAGVPVVPVAIDGAGKMMPPNSWGIRPGVIHIAVGKPMPTAHLTEYDRDVLPELAREEVIQLLKTIS